MAIGLIPVIMSGGAIVGRFATKELAKRLGPQLAKGLRIVMKPADKAKGMPKVTSVSQANKLKPTTKVANKKPTASLNTTATASAARAKKVGQAARGRTAAQVAANKKKMAAATVTAGSLASMLTGDEKPKKPNKRKQPGMSDRKTRESNVLAKTTPPKKSAGTFGEAFKKARAKGVGTAFTYGGNKFVAVRDSDIPKSIKGTKAERLTKYLNKQNKKGR